MEKSFSASFAGQLIKSAIEANAIKLGGPGGTEQHSKDAAKRDAAYLLALLTALTGGSSAD